MSVRPWIALCATALVGLCAPGPAARAQSSANPAESATAAPQPSPSRDAEDPKQVVTLPAGTLISVRLADPVDSNHNHIGDRFSGTVDPSVIIENRVVIPRGTEAHLMMVYDKKGGRVHGHAEVQLALVSLVMNGRQLEVESNTYDKTKGVLATKAGPEAKASTDAAGDVALGGTPGVADPVIAAFRAARVEKPAGSKLDFTLTTPFTFEKPPVNARP